MTFLDVISMIFLAGVAAVLVMVGISLGASRSLRFWTLVCLPLWILTLWVLRPVYWPLESDYAGGGAPWLAFLLGLPMGVASGVSALIIVAAWTTRIVRHRRESKISQYSEEEEV
jgi:hypothetical protein